MATSGTPGTVCVANLSVLKAGCKGYRPFMFCLALG